MHGAVSGSNNESIKNMVDVRGEISLGELFNAVDEAGNSPLFCAKKAETVRTILDLDENCEIALERRKDLKPLAEYCIEQRYHNIGSIDHFTFLTTLRVIISASLFLPFLPYCGSKFCHAKETISYLLLVMEMRHRLFLR